MDTKTLAQLKEQLHVRKGELQNDLRQLDAEIRDLGIDQEAERGGVGNHLADDGSSLGEQERIATIESDFQEQLRMIDDALERMDKGTYGICRRCGRPIAEERLEALPFAAYCVECQAHLEREAALYGNVVPPS